MPANSLSQKCVVMPCHGFAFCKLSSAQIFGACFLHYLICIISLVNWVLKQTASSKTSLCSCYFLPYDLQQQFIKLRAMCGRMVRCSQISSGLRLKAYERLRSDSMILKMNFLGLIGKHYVQRKPNGAHHPENIILLTVKYAGGSITLLGENS